MSLKAALTEYAENNGQYHSKVSFSGNHSKLFVKLLQYDFDGTMTDLGTRAVSPNHKSIDIIVYPNPIKDLLHIKNTSKYEIERTILLDANGKELWNNLGPIHNIDMSQMSKGIYFVKSTSAHETVTKKIIKD